MCVRGARDELARALDRLDTLERRSGTDALAVAPGYLEQLEAQHKQHTARVRGPARTL